MHTPQDCNCTCDTPNTKCISYECRQGFCHAVSKCITLNDPCYTYTGQCDETNGTQLSFTHDEISYTAGCETQPVCDDGDPCTKDICSPEGVCSTEPIDCEDGNFCTEDQCRTPYILVFSFHHALLSVDGKCLHVPVLCDPIDRCNRVKCIDTIGCVNEPIDESECDDFNVCTADSCDPAIGCVNVNATLCDDGVACTDDKCDPFVIFLPLNIPPLISIEAI